MLTPRSILRLGARMFYLRRKLIFECDTRPRTQARGSEIVFRFGNADDLRKLTAEELSYSEDARDFGLERLRLGDRLVLGELDGSVVFYGWVMFGQMDLSVRNYIPLDPSRAYTYKLFTVARCRGRRVCPAYYEFIRDELRNLGVRSMIAWVEAGNEASIRTHVRAGCRQMGTIRHIQFLFRSYFLVSRTVRDLLAQAPPLTGSSSDPIQCNS